jgi:hypothetical protein
MNSLKAGCFFSKRKHIFLLLKVVNNKEDFQIVYLDDCGKVCHVYTDWAEHFVHGSYLLFDGEDVRYFTQKELERLQTLPDGYTSCLTRNKAAGVIGDGWTVDVVAHILSFIPKQN